MKMLQNDLNRKTERGFTLLELIIVSALITIFSAIAMFNWKSVVATTKVRATKAETQQMSNALSAVYYDIGMFPKLCYMNMTNKELFGPTDNRFPVPAGFHYMGFPEVVNYQSKIWKNWKGSYMSTQTLNIKTFGVQSRYATVRLPNGEEWGWPADLQGQPYVLYLMKFDYEGNVPVWGFIEGPTEEADFFCALVSYGENMVPGSDAIKDSIDNIDDYKLFKRDPGSLVFDMLDEDEYDEDEYWERTSGYDFVTGPESDDVIHEF